MSADQNGHQQNAPRPNVRIEYDSRAVQFVSQFLVSASDEGLIIDLSGGAVADPDSGELVLPIQSRIALSAGGAQRLVDMLQRVLEQLEGNPRPASPLPAAARLPKLRPS